MPITTKHTQSTQQTTTIHRTTPTNIVITIIRTKRSKRGITKLQLHQRKASTSSQQIGFSKSGNFNFEESNKNAHSKRRQDDQHNQTSSSSKAVDYP
jgi:hypothetical protein